MPTQMAPWDGAARQGVDLHVATAPFDDFWKVPEVEAPASLTVHRFDPRGWIKRQHLWWVYPGLGRLIKDLRPDLIHVAAEVYGLFYSQVDFDEYPIAGHSTDNIWDDGSWIERTIRLRRASRILGRLTGLASWNQAGIDLGRKYGLRPDRPTTIVPSRLTSSQPFETAAQHRQMHRQDFGFGAEVVVGFVGRFVPQKGGEWLIDSFSESSHRAAARLVFVGKGPEEEQWRSRAGSRGIDAQWLGSVPPERIPGLLAALDVLVLPSLTVHHWAEQFGRVLVEAMFAGTPVIASRSGSIPEVVAEGAGILVEEANRSELATALAELIDDDDRRAALGRQGYESAISRYSADALGGELVRFWKECLGGDI